MRLVLFSQANRDDDIEHICERWEVEKTGLARDFGRSYATPTRLTSLEISIKLSMESPIMSDSARLLLSVLAIFPDGLHAGWLASLPRFHSPSGLVSPTQLAECLLDTSLAFMQPLLLPSEPSAYRLLVPIREYISTRTPRIPDDVLDILVRWVRLNARGGVWSIIKYALGRDQTPWRLRELADTAAYGENYFLIFTDSDGAIQLLSEASLGPPPDDRTQAICAMMSEVRKLGTPGEVARADIFDISLNTFIRLGDKQKQAQCLLKQAQCLPTVLMQHSYGLKDTPVEQTRYLMTLEMALEVSVALQWVMKLSLIILFTLIPVCKGSAVHERVSDCTA